jgi:hypothetical protein
MTAIKSMGHFTAIGMRTVVEDPDAMVINTCSNNDTAERGTLERGKTARWSWANPTNRAITHEYCGLTAVSVEALWQGTKSLDRPNEGFTWYDVRALTGEWRRGKGKKPLGAWAGAGMPIIRNQGEARRKIYIPAYRRLLMHWICSDAHVANWVNLARQHNGPVYLRDFDTGRGIDREGPMSHAWVLAAWLNGPGFGTIRTLEIAERNETVTA